MFTQPLRGGAALTPLHPWQADAYLAALDADREHLAAAVPVARCVHTVDDARRYLQRWAQEEAADTGRLLGIWQDDRLVGSVQIAAFDILRRSCELGVWICRSAQGRGLVTEACRHVLQWAFDVRGLQRVQWTTSTGNARSIAVARRLGMTREGVLRSAGVLAAPALDYVEPDVRWDAEVWSLLAREWAMQVSPLARHS
ncbi:MAG: GNAT family N-acetyltransferase [Hamadaea sp.]|nr:GNAT family N-acetyltransferase [Hamadaea sp.]